MHGEIENRNAGWYHDGTGTLDMTCAIRNRHLQHCTCLPRTGRWCEMRQGSTTLMLSVVVMLMHAVASAGLGEAANPNRKESLRDPAKVKTLHPDEDVNAIKPLAEEIVTRSRSNHAPLVNLIDIDDSRIVASVGAMFLEGGLFCVALVLAGSILNIRRDPAWKVLIGGIVAGVMAVGMTVVGACLFVPGYQQCRRLAREGRTAEAIVIGRWQSPGSKRTYHEVAYLFVARLPDGSARTVACCVDGATLYSQHQTMDRLTVRYLPSDLRVGGPVSPWRDYFEPLLLLALALGALTLTLLFLRLTTTMRTRLRHEGEYKPPGKLIRVGSPTLWLYPGAILFLGGVVLLALVLIVPTLRHRANRIGTGAGGVAWAAVGAGLFGVGYRQRKRLAREGRTAQAEVIGRWWSRWGGRGPHHHVAYEFVAQLPDGSTLTVGCCVPGKKFYDRLQIGDKFTVRYLPSNLRVGELQQGVARASSETGN